MGRILDAIPAALAMALFAGAAQAAVGCGAVAGNLVTNCGFETGDFSGWTQAGNGAFTYVGASGTTEGAYAAFFGPVGSPGSISQTLGTTLGTTYTVNFTLGWGSGEGGGEEGPTDIPVQSTSAEVIWDGNTIFSVIDGASFSPTPYSIPVVGGANSLLTFQFRNDPQYFQLDAISVVAAVTSPEPASLAMLAMGLGLLGVMRRRA